MENVYLFDEEGLALDLRDKMVVIEYMDSLSLADVPWFNDDEQLVESFIEMDKDNYKYASKNLQQKFKYLLTKKDKELINKTKIELIDEFEREEEFCF